jgi:hypothetical protein
MDSSLPGGTRVAGKRAGMSNNEAKTIQEPKVE